MASSYFRITNDSHFGGRSLFSNSRLKLAFSIPPCLLLYPIHYFLPARFEVIQTVRSLFRRRGIFVQITMRAFPTQSSGHTQKLRLLESASIASRSFFTISTIFSEVMVLISFHPSSADHTTLCLSDSVCR